jgi:predicted amidophosphoribosyltransferase
MRCGGCGAQLRLRPASCPLCGEELREREVAPFEPPEDPEDYRSNVRALREELQRLRGGGQAEAV